jgi:hypothetical protein
MAAWVLILICHTRGSLEENMCHVDIYLTEEAAKDALVQWFKENDDGIQDPFNEEIDPYEYYIAEI